MPYRFRRLLTAVLLTLALVVTVIPGQVLAGGSIGPRQMLYEYYNQINFGNYGVAYEQWVNPPQTYASFVAGYADTVSVATYFGGFQAYGPGRVDGRVAGILVGTHRDGSQVAYSGCYDVRYNDTATGIGQWSITGGTFTPMAYSPLTGGHDNGGSDEILSEINCLTRTSADGSYLTVQSMLVDYFDSVNRGDLTRAYGFWVNPPQTFEEFVNGWATTVETVMFYGNYRYSGSIYAPETGRVPVVLMGYHTDGSLAAYQGCIGVNYASGAVPQWRIWNAYLTPMTFITTPDDAAITAALNATCY